MNNLKVIIGLIVGIGVIVFGITLRSKPNEYTRKVNLTVTSAIRRYTSTPDGDDISYDVSGTVEECPGKIIKLNYRPSGMLLLNLIPVVRGDVLPVWIKQDCNYPYATQNVLSNKTSSNILIIGGILYLLLVVYLISKGLV
jgi:hypothetical protein